MSTFRKLQVDTAPEYEFARNLVDTGFLILYTEMSTFSFLFSRSMNRVYHRWFSPALQRNMELLVFGIGGTPVVVFPTSQGRFFDYEDRGMVGALWDAIEEGRMQLFCVDSVDAESWYNYGAHPRNRVARHADYECYLLTELLQFIKQKNPSDRLCVTGCSFGGYHAVNFTLRHPDVVDTCISLGGAFDIRQFIAGYYDDDCYFNNPVDYLPNLEDQWYLNLYRRKVRFILATGEWDMCLDATVRLSRVFDSKGVRHWLDVWGDHTGHDWPWWKMMIRKYLYYC
jgi:esterase/lipase superfamily enzyme